MEKELRKGRVGYENLAMCPNDAPDQAPPSQQALPKLLKYLPAFLSA
jgi:hypothetical protein